MPFQEVDHEDGLTILVPKLRRPNIQAVVGAWLREAIQPLEAEGLELADKLFDPEKLEGDPLQALARLVGAVLISGDDAAQRVLINVAILIRRSSGTPADLLLASQAFGNDPVTLVEHFPATVFVGLATEVEQDVDLQLSQLLRAVSAGVHLQVEFTAVTLAQTMLFRDPTTLVKAIAAWTSAVGTAANPLWAGSADDLVGSQDLSITAPAEIARAAPGGLPVGFPEAVLALSGSGRFETASPPSNMDFSQGSDRVLAFAVRLFSVPGSDAGLVGSWAGASSAGWRLYVPSGTSDVALDLTDGANSLALSVSLGTGVDWSTVVVTFDDATNTVTLATDSASTSGAWTFSAPAASVLEIGSLTNGPAAAADAEITALGAAAAAPTAATVASDLLDELSGVNAVIDTAQGLGDDDDTTVGGALAGVSRVVGDVLISPLEYVRRATEYPATLYPGNDPDPRRGLELVQVGASQKGVAVTGLLEDNGVTQAAFKMDATSEGWRSASAATNDLDGTSQLTAVVFRTTQTQPLPAVRGIYNKREPGGLQRGPQFFATTTGGVRFRVGCSGGTVDFTETADHTDGLYHVCAFLRDENAGTMSFRTDLSSSTFSTGAALGSCASTQAWQLGFGIFSSLFMEVPAIIHWRGTDIEGVSLATFVPALRAAIVAPGF